MWIPKGEALIRGQHLFEAQWSLEEMQYIKMSKNSSAKYYQDDKKRLPKKTCERYQSLSK